MDKIVLPKQGNPGNYYRFYGTDTMVSIYVEDFGADGINVDVYAQGEHVTDLRVFKDGRQPLTCNINGAATVSVQVARKESNNG